MTHLLCTIFSHLSNGWDTRRAIDKRAKGRASLAANYQLGFIFGSISRFLLLSLEYIAPH